MGVYKIDMNSQNTSHAVMAQRFESPDSLDDFPTPPWAARALLNYVIGADHHRSQTWLETACGVGYMARTLSEYFADVTASDIHDFGYGAVSDFLTNGYAKKYDWVKTLLNKNYYCSYESVDVQGHITIIISNHNKNHQN